MDGGSGKRTILLHLILLLSHCPARIMMLPTHGFAITIHCIRSESVIETLHNLTVIRCAAKCATTKGCRGFGYDRDSSSCRLGSVIVESGSSDSNCVNGESVRLSESAFVGLCDISDGWYLHSVRDTCIKMFFSLKTHQEALEDCETRGAKIPIISTLETRDMYVSLMDGNNPDWIRTGTASGMWTDATVIPGTHMSFQWSDGTNVTSEMWAPEEPSGNAECTQLYYLYMLLADKLCSGMKKYVCEKPAQ